MLRQGNDDRLDFLPLTDMACQVRSEGGVSTPQLPLPFGGPSARPARTAGGCVGKGIFLAGAGPEWTSPFRPFGSPAPGMVRAPLVQEGGSVSN